jgi:hypothetical protein
MTYYTFDPNSQRYDTDMAYYTYYTFDPNSQRYGTDMAY